jgi:hypothetical protein
VGVYEYDYDDWQESAREEYEFEIGKQAVEEFQTERLQSFYKDHTDLAVKPIQMAKEARSILQQSPSAALVFATVSIEVGFKAIILQPIISGLVHEESLASLVTEMFVKNTRQDGVLKVAHQVLKKYASIDLLAITLPNHKKSYWGELDEAQRLRNVIVHRAESELAIFKEFPLGKVHEGMRLEFRAEATNALNHPQFKAPNSNAASGNYGQIVPNGPVTVSSPRELQLGLKLYF